MMALRAAASLCSACVQPTFLLTAIFPPPPACPEILSRFYRTGTWRTADADKPSVMQNIIGYVIPVYIFLYPFGIPMQQGIEFDDLIAFIPLDDAVVLPLGRMFCPQTRHPDGLFFQSPLQ